MSQFSPHHRVIPSSFTSHLLIFNMVSASFITAAPLLATLASACLPPTTPPSNGTQPQYPYPIVGSDEPADIATTSYFSNHLSLNVHNLTRSLEFYNRVFGLRELFTLRVSEHYSIAYMAHQHGGKNGTGYQTTAELLREQRNAQGLIELVHVDVSTNSITSSSQRPNTFGHIGIIVPDIEATQKRLETFPDVNIIKAFGEDVSQEGAVANATSLGPEEQAQLDEEEIALILATIRGITKPIIFAEDPDGNLLEIMAQEGSDLV
jgi:lactoylglutathione lyase